MLQALITAINSIGELLEPGHHLSKRVSQFSDSIVVSFEVSEESAVFWLVNDIALTIITLVEQGFLLRGGVTVGALLHTERYLVGPALVRAYDLESKEAVVPRVVFDDNIFPIARRYHAKQHSADDEEKYTRSLLREDDDGKLYFDFTSWHYVVAEAGANSEQYGGYLFRIGVMAEKCLLHPCPSVVKKGQWLLRHYLRSLDEIASSASSLTNFPRYEEVGRRATERLKS